VYSFGDGSGDGLDDDDDDDKEVFMLLWALHTGQDKRRPLTFNTF
jgi:hypothetical protein